MTNNAVANNPWLKLAVVSLTSIVLIFTILWGINTFNGYRYGNMGYGNMYGNMGYGQGNYYYGNQQYDMNMQGGMYGNRNWGNGMNIYGNMQSGMGGMNGRGMMGGMRMH